MKHIGRHHPPVGEKLVPQAERRGPSRGDEGVAVLWNRAAVENWGRKAKKIRQEGFLPKYWEPLR